MTAAETVDASVLGKRHIRVQTVCCGNSGMCNSWSFRGCLDSDGVKAIDLQNRDVRDEDVVFHPRIEWLGDSRSERMSKSHCTR